MRGLRPEADFFIRYCEGLGSYAGAASLFAPLAGSGAFLAMLNVGAVLRAFVAAGFADFGAHFQQVSGVFRTAGHEAGG